MYVKEPTGYIPRNKISDEEVFVENSTYDNRQGLKTRLLSKGFKYECSTETCSVGGNWLGDKISLHLDHVNGVSNDNRIENLRFLCPNCHSQTPTYAGRNIIHTKKEYTCSCGNSMYKLSNQCKPCHYKNLSKISSDKYPPLDKLISLVKEKGYEGTGRMFDVAGNTIRKRIKVLSS